MEKLEDGRMLIVVNEKEQSLARAREAEATGIVKCAKCQGAEGVLEGFTLVPPPPQSQPEQVASKMTKGR
jgi:hypothetical protein